MLSPRSRTTSQRLLRAKELNLDAPCWAIVHSLSTRSWCLEPATLIGSIMSSKSPEGVAPRILSGGHGAWGRDSRPSPSASFGPNDCLPIALFVCVILWARNRLPMIDGLDFAHIHSCELSSPCERAAAGAKFSRRKP